MTWKYLVSVRSPDSLKVPYMWDKIRILWDAKNVLTHDLNICRVTWKYLVSVRSPDSASINFATKLQISCYQMQTCPMHLNYSHHLQASLVSMQLYCRQAEQVFKITSDTETHLQCFKVACLQLFTRLEGFKMGCLICPICLSLRTIFTCPWECQFCITWLQNRWAGCKEKV